VPRLQGLEVDSIDTARSRNYQPPDSPEHPQTMKPRTLTWVRGHSDVLRHHLAVEVGFEPTDELPHHTLSSTARHRPPVVPTVRHVPIQPLGGQWRTVPDGGE
jgi:hypothetical protein